MVRFPDVVRVAPEKVWDALADPTRRASDPKLQASMENGEAGATGSVARFQLGRAKWREKVLETQAPERLVLEEQLASGNDVTARMEWSLRPLKLGTLLVLDIKGITFKDKLVARFLRRWRYRRLVRSVKVAAEGPPRSLLDSAAAPSPAGQPEAAGPAAPEPVPSPPPEPAKPGKKSATKRTAKAKPRKR